MAERITSADVIAINSSEEIVGIISEIAKSIPELDFFAASPVPKISYDTLVCTALPTAGFRAINSGRTRTSGVYVNRTVACKYLDASWDADNAALSGINWGDPVRQLQSDHLLAAFKAWQRQVYDGTLANADGFPGMASLFPYADSEGVVDATGSSAGTGSSIYLVRTGIQDVCVPWGKEGRIEEGEIFQTQLYDGEGKPYLGKAQKIEGWAGLQITNAKSIVRIANITADSGHDATDALVTRAIVLFAQRYGIMPDGCFMSYRSWGQIQSHRTATTPTGQEAPLPENVQKVQIHPTLGITDTETLLEAEPEES
jgi:hypothetical protein